LCRIIGIFKVCKTDIKSDILIRTKSYDLVQKIQIPSAAVNSACKFLSALTGVTTNNNSLDSAQNLAPVTVCRLHVMAS